MPTTLLRTEQLTFARDGDQINGYAAWLRHDDRGPAIVIIPDVRGLTEHYCDIARRFANEGFFALAVDLYSREGMPNLPDIESALRWMRQLNDSRILKDLDGAVRFLGSRPEVRNRSIGITGFCMGGQYAIMASCTVPNVAACVSFYGMLRYAEKTPNRPESPLDMASRLTCPYLGLFGEDDAMIPRSDVKELESILRRAGKNFQTRVYPGAGHAFFNDTRPEVYRAEAAKDAWTRTLAFFRAHLDPK
jgi:carboxymethylenebutenolidase